MPVVGYLDEDRYLLVFTPRVGVAGGSAGAVDHHAERQAEHAHHLYGQFQIVQTERRGFCYQQHIIRVANALDDRARGPGRGVNDHKTGVGRGGFHGPDHRRTHGLANVQNALNKPDPVRVARLEPAGAPARFGERSRAAHKPTAAATMAQFREDQHLSLDGNDGAVLTEYAAQAAVRALGCLERGNAYMNRFAFGDCRFEKQGAVGLFDVAVQIGHRVALARGHVCQVGGDGGLAGAAFPACDSDSHGFLPACGARAATSRRHPGDPEAEQELLRLPGSLNYSSWALLSSSSMRFLIPSSASSK